MEPSKDLAFQLIELGREHPQTKKLGVDMLRQLSLHHDYVLMLLQDGYYLEAMRFARKNKVKCSQIFFFYFFGFFLSSKSE